ncbi:RND family transporter [Schlesneria sp. T3-172]|uniref:efflux RND transporter permease subunit n=1 Tax=Schlesneria sphaerica TaxID=3373610 RepID=UPI0037C5F8DD
MPRRGFDLLVEFLIHRHRFLVGIAFLLTVLAIRPASRLAFDQSIESLYAAKNVRLQDYSEGKRWFGGDEFVFVAYSDPDLFSDDAQTRLEELANRLEQVPGVVEGSVQSLDRTLAMERLPFLKHRREELLDFSRGILLGDDNQTTAVAVRLLEPSQSPVTRDESLAQIQKIANEQPLPTYVVGEPVLVHDMFRYAQEDGEWMGWAASVLLILVILFFLRSLRSIILPFVIVQCAILWTKAVLFQSGMQLSMVSSILGSLVTIVGVSTVVYMSLYYRKMREQADRVNAFRQTLHVIGMDIFWVCLTTAVGFGAQLSSRLHPVRSFGLTMVIGSLFVLVAMILVLPAGFLLGAEGGTLRKPRGDRQMNQSLEGLAKWVLLHPYHVWITCAILMAWGVMGLFRLKIETDFSKNFRATSPVVRGLDFIETRLGGTGAWEVNFPAPDSLNDEHLEKVARLAQSLREIPGEDGPALTKVLAVTDGLELIPTIPLLAGTTEAKANHLNRVQPEFIPSLYNAEAGRMRIMLRAYERQSSEAKQQLIERVKTLAQTEFPEAKVTGLFVLLTFLIESLLADQWTDIMLGGSCLIAVMSVAYRSLWMGFVSLVPNIIPIVLLLGGMGWLGFPVNIGTAMISSDTMGLTIHDSIFYLSAFLRARRSGLDFPTSLHHVQSEVRQPLLYSNIALIVGFLVLATSHFVPLIYFGVIVSVAIAGGLAVNLLLLPLLLQLGERFEKAVPEADEPSPASSL